MITDAELKMLADGGIRGIRFSITDPRNSSTSFEMIEPLSKRVNALGWHVQINMTANQIVASDDLWNRLPSPIVFDHMGHVPEPAGGLGRTLHPVAEWWSAHASRCLQQQPSDCADSRRRRDPGRDDSRRAHHSPGRPAAPATASGSGWGTRGAIGRGTSLL
jgi:hypothetical protein